jgi:hypothetical protein
MVIQAYSIQVKYRNLERGIELREPNNDPVIRIYIYNLLLQRTSLFLELNMF